MMTTRLVPNHHGDHPGFTGPKGVLAAVTMVVGRGAAAELACRLTHVDADDRVVDIGCGPGAAVRAAAGRGADAVGVDPEQVMLTLARRTSLHRRRVRFVRGGAESIPLGDGWATVAWSLAAVHHWPDLATGLAEVARVLGDGGRFLAMERRTRPGASGLGSHGWTDQQADSFVRLLADAGFGDVAHGIERAGRGTVQIVTGVRAAR